MESSIALTWYVISASEMLLSFLIVRMFYYVEITPIVKD